MRQFVLVGGVLGLFLGSPVWASCGAVLCSLNTQWQHEGVASEPGWRLDARYEWIDQDQVRTGTDDIAVGEVYRHHDEVETVNRNALFALEYVSTDGWGVSAVVPVVSHEHSHIHNHHGEQLGETWDFSGVGDAQVLGRYALHGGLFGLVAGLKLPTGATDVENAEGDAAERTLQPGTGTTDGLLGFYYHPADQGAAPIWFLQGLWQRALNEYHAFRPGGKGTLDLGYYYAVNESLKFSLQLNMLVKRSDRGDEAESEDSGGEYVFLSPGFRYSLGSGIVAYGFLQRPLYQSVNGVQLTAGHSLAAGLSYRF